MDGMTATRGRLQQIDRQTDTRAPHPAVKKNVYLHLSAYPFQAILPTRPRP